MRQEDNYWIKRLQGGQVSRRRLLGGAAIAGVGAASLGLVGCGDDDDSGSSKTAPAGTSATPKGGASAAATTAATKVKGGTARFTSANNTFDTMDIDRSRFTPFAVLAGFTNLGLVEYASYAKAELRAAFCSKMPEQPDPLTMNFTLRDNMYWHNKPPVNGRLATVDDMVNFIKRNKAGVLQDGTQDPSFFRAPEYTSVASVTAVDSKTMQVKFDKPNPFFLGTLAGGYSKVQAPEAEKQFEKDYTSLKADYIIGTGPYTLTVFDPAGNISLRAFDKYFGERYIDGIDYFPLFTDNAALQAAFEQKQIDEYGPRTKSVLDDLSAKYKGQLTVSPSFDANPMAGTYYGGAKPWNDPNLIGAIFRSIDRRALINQMFQGQAALSGNVPPTQGQFGITEKDLIALPGYLDSHDTDLAEAKKMWAAGGGPALGTITVDIADIWEGAYSGVSALIINMLKSNLGNDFQPSIQPYSIINGKIPAKKYGNGNNNIWYGWISDVTKLEPSLDLWNTYNSKSPQFDFIGGVKIQAVDDLTDKLLLELDQTKRTDLCKQVDSELIKAYGAGIPYNMVHISSTMRWNYYHSEETVAFVTAHQFADQAWLDPKDPTFQGRKA
jgi:ABC-type transport system substrate-binding protein